MAQRRIFATIFLGCWAIGCAPKLPSVEDVLTLREQRIAVAQREYVDVTKLDLLKAILEVFKYLDESDVEFDIRQDNLLVSRKYNFYAVFHVTWGKDFWEFKFKDLGGSIVVTSAFDFEINQGMFPAPVSTNFKENIQIGGRQNVGASTDDYLILHDRVEYFLGRRTEWPTCEAYEAKAIEPKRQMVMCRGIGIDDRTPPTMAKK